MNKNLFLLVFGTFLLGSIACQKVEIPAITTDAELLENLQAEVSNNRMTAISYAVVKGDKLLTSGGLGVADKTSKRLATATTRYLTASISKTITGVALMQLVEQKRIALDDDINAVLPFSVRNPRFPNDKITYRMLLSHRSSLSDDYQEGLDLYCWGEDCSMSLEDYCKAVFLPNGEYSSSENFSKKSPGSSEDYSNLGLALVGYLVERITKMPFDVYCNNAIFTPLGMTKTAWRLADSPLGELAVPYSKDITAQNPHYTFPDYPNGGLRTTVEDLSKFLRAVISNGTFNGQKILSEASMAEMKTPQLGGTEQCLAFYFDTVNGKSVLGHSGGEQGVTTEMFYDPATNIGVIVFNNDDDTDLETVLSLLFSYGENKAE